MKCQVGSKIKKGVSNNIFFSFLVPSLCKQFYQVRLDPRIPQVPLKFKSDHKCGRRQHPDIQTEIDKLLYRFRGAGNGWRIDVNQSKTPSEIKPPLTSLKYKPPYDFWTIIGDSDHSDLVHKKCLLIFFAKPYEIVDFQTITTTVLLQKLANT